MPEESYGFTQARTRLEEIVAQVRKKDTSLEKSLDLLEEGVRLANQCTELIDHADWDAAGAPAAAIDADGTGADDASGSPEGETGDAQGRDTDAPAGEAGDSEQDSDEASATEEPQAS